MTEITKIPAIFTFMRDLVKITMVDCAMACMCEW